MKINITGDYKAIRPVQNLCYVSNYLMTFPEIQPSNLYWLFKTTLN